MSNYRLMTLAPPGFALGNYDGVESMDAANWCANLILRGKGRDEYLTGIVEDDSFTSGLLEASADLAHIEEQLAFGPVRSLNHQESMRLYEWIWRDDLLRKRMERYESMNRTCEEVPAEHLLDAAAELLTDEYDELLSLALSPVDKRGDRPEELGTWCHLSVDVSAPDSVLLEQFKLWLAAARKEIGFEPGKKRFTEKDFERWGRNQVLAYIDLVRWNRGQGRFITDQEAGDILFPDSNVDRAERIRKGVRPMADGLLKPDFLWALHQQAIAERRHAAN